ncbi:ligand-binding protein SH3 [Achromobacter ruhlandii]|uniref:Ligand-binding protein SH3 n=1 Tax=Achromobacter ruhlandii TaxID=72557 RepID=A0A848NHR8_9BURK|nr:SMR family transporter [Achromobacter ruhlandii]NMU89195.1 ligand-binding protein SH3 [Achromobacter ruhlandii]
MRLQFSLPDGKNMSYFWLALSALCSVIASVALKVGAHNAMNSEGVLRTFGGLLPYAIAIGAYGMGFGLYALALRKLELSLAYPLMVAISIAGVVAYGIFFGNEAVTSVRVIGAVLIAVGIFFLSR